MNILPVLITCRGREEMLSATLRRFGAIDWPGEAEAVQVHVDPYPPESPKRREERQEENALRALQHGISSGDDFILFLEDDLEFNAHLHHNLMHWAPLSWKHFGMASLYNPNIAELVRVQDGHYFVANPNAVYGSQAYVFSRTCAQFICANWGRVEGMQDIKMSRLAALGGWQIVYHAPSLVQHKGLKSAWGGHYHFAPDYDPNWKS